MRQSRAREQAERDRILAALETAERRIGELSAGIQGLRGRVAAIRQHLQALDDERDRRHKRLQTERRALGADLRAAYLLGREPRLRLLLNLDAAARVERLLTYAGYLARERGRRVEAIRGELKALARITARQQALQARLQVRQERLDTDLRALRQVQAGRRALAADLARALQEKDARLKAMQRDAAALRDLLRHLQQETLEMEARERPFSRLRGRLPWPLKGRIAVRYGTPRAGGIPWDGTLIRAPLGSEVRAVHHGRVVYADWLRGFGLLLILDHGEGYMTLYGFNQALLKETGEWVDAGEPVALLGDSGGRQAAGLYFGIRHDGKPLDPQHWCRQVRHGRIR